MKIRFPAPIRDINSPHHGGKSPLSSSDLTPPWGQDCHFLASTPPHHGSPLYIYHVPMAFLTRPNQPKTWKGQSLMNDSNHCKHCGDLIYGRAPPKGQPVLYCSVECRRGIERARPRWDKNSAACSDDGYMAQRSRNEALTDRQRAYADQWLQDRRTELGASK